MYQKIPGGTEKTNEQTQVSYFRYSKPIQTRFLLLHRQETSTSKKVQYKLVLLKESKKITKNH